MKIVIPCVSPVYKDAKHFSKNQGLRSGNPRVRPILLVVPLIHVLTHDTSVKIFLEHFLNHSMEDESINVKTQVYKLEYWHYSSLNFSFIQEVPPNLKLKKTDPIFICPPPSK